MATCTNCGAEKQDSEQFCGQCGWDQTVPVATGATQIAVHDAETRRLKDSEKAALGLDKPANVPVIQAVPFVPSGPIPGGAFDTSANQPVQQKRPWLLIALLSLLALAIGFGLYQSGRAAQAEQALANMPTAAAIITLPTDAPSPTPTSAPTAQPTQAKPTAAAAAAPTAANTATALPPTAIPDMRPEIEAEVTMHDGTPSGNVLELLEVGDRFKPSFWMNVGGDIYYYGSSDTNTGWFNGSLGAPNFNYSTLSELVLVQSVKAELADRGFISTLDGRAIAFIFVDGTYGQRVGLPGVDGEFVAVTNGDFLQVVKREGSTLYFTTNSNIVDGKPATQISGALPEWVITGEGVPPAPTPEPTARASTGSSGGASCTGSFDVYRYVYNPSSSVEYVRSSQIAYSISGLPAEKCHNFKSIGVVLGGDGGDSLDLINKGPVKVANGRYRIRLVQYKGPSYELISEQWVDVTEGNRTTAIFKWNGGGPVR